MSLDHQEQDVPHIEIHPRSPAKHTIIWLHGLGADGNDFAPIVPELHLPAALGVRFIFPHAPIRPVTINNGYEMRAWYDIASLAIAGQVDHAGIAESNAFVHDLIEKEVARGISTENIMLAGFSQGAVIALTTGLTYPERLGGIMALSGYLPPEALQKAHVANQSTPLFLAHGQDDPVVPFMLGEAALTALKAAGYAVEWHAYPMPHSVCPAEINDISLWIQRVWT